ncbi:MAG: hypothetical protein ACRCV9_07475 [Burkholderiaceae bacterium]
MRVIGVGIALLGALVLAYASQLIPHDTVAGKVTAQPIAAAPVKDAAVALPALSVNVDPSMNPIAVKGVLRWEHQRDRSKVVLKSPLPEIVYDVAVLLDGQEVHRGQVTGGPTSKTDQRSKKGSDERTVHSLSVSQSQLLEVRATLRKCEEVYCDRSAAHFMVARNVKSRATGGVIAVTLIGILIMLAGLMLARQK